MVKRNGKKKAIFGSGDTNTTDGGVLIDSNGRDDSDKEEEEDYLDESDEEASALNQYKAFVYVGSDGKLIYVPHETDEGNDSETEEECKEEEVKKNVGVNNEDKMMNDKEKNFVDSSISSGDGAEIPVLLEKCHVNEEEGEDDGDSRQQQQQEEKRGCLHDDDISTKEEQSRSNECPLPRIRHALAMRGNTIYVFGGLLEIKEREYTLDDCWSLDLRTR